MQDIQKRYRREEACVFSMIHDEGMQTIRKHLLNPPPPRVEKISFLSRERNRVGVM